MVEQAGHNPVAAVDVDVTKGAICDLGRVDRFL